MTTYRVTATANDEPIIDDIEAESPDQAWAEACKKNRLVRLYNGKVEELPTRSELLARIQELETAGRPFAHPDLCKRLPNNGASSDEQAVIFVRNKAVITLADCKRIAALLNTEKE